MKKKRETKAELLRQRNALAAALEAALWEVQCLLSNRREKAGLQDGYDLGYLTAVREVEDRFEGIRDAAWQRLEGADSLAGHTILEGAAGALRRARNARHDAILARTNEILGEKA